MKILLTGATSWAAAEIAHQLDQAGQQVIGLDLNTPPDSRQAVFSEFRKTDVADPASWGDWLAGTGAAVHLAIAREAGALFRTNVEGTYRLFEAARRHGVSRLVLIGSAPVHIPAAERQRLSLRGDCVAAEGDDFGYDLTKCLQERIARHFSVTYGMAVLVLRAGHLVDGRAGADPLGRPLASLRYCRGGWVDRGDLARAVLAALLDWQGGGYEVLNVIGSFQARQEFEMERTEQELGVVCDYGFWEYS